MIKGEGDVNTIQLSRTRGSQAAFSRLVPDIESLATCSSQSVGRSCQKLRLEPSHTTTTDDSMSSFSVFLEISLPFMINVFETASEFDQGVSLIPRVDRVQSLQRNEPT